MKQNEQPAEVSPFAFDKTSTLIKKFFVYKAMGSNLFINYSLSGVHWSYRIFGKNLTNTLIERTSGSIFTGGVTLQQVKAMRSFLRERQTGVIPMCVVEGLSNPPKSALDNFCNMTIRSIQQMASDCETHFAFKLTMYISIQLMQKLSTAQVRFTRDILELAYDATNTSVLSRERLASNLEKNGISFNPAELD